MNAHELLGVPVGAGRQQVKAAYRRYVRSHHPDMGGDPAGFRAGVEAYRMLVGNKHAVGSAAEVVFHRTPRGLKVPVAWLRAQWRPRRFAARRVT